MWQFIPLKKAVDNVYRSEMEKVQQSGGWPWFFFISSADKDRQTRVSFTLDLLWLNCRQLNKLLSDFVRAPPQRPTGGAHLL